MCMDWIEENKVALKHESSADWGLLRDLQAAICIRSVQFHFRRNHGNVKTLKRAQDSSKIYRLFYISSYITKLFLIGN